MAAAAARAVPGGEEEEEFDDDDGIGDDVVGIEGSPPASPFSSDDAETRTGCEEDSKALVVIRIERDGGMEDTGEEDDGSDAAAASEGRRRGLAWCCCCCFVLAAAFEARPLVRQRGVEEADVDVEASKHRGSQRRPRSILVLTVRWWWWWWWRRRSRRK